VRGVSSETPSPRAPQPPWRSARQRGFRLRCAAVPWRRGQHEAGRVDRRRSPARWPVAA